MTLLNIGGGPEYATSATTAAANPQLQFFENFPGHLGAEFAAISQFTLSVHAVNIPLSLSYNFPVMLIGKTNTTTTNQSAIIYQGLYSLSGSTLSIANSARWAFTYTGESGTSWASFATSATQNISPGAWYSACLVQSVPAFRLYINSSANPRNAIPGGFLMGRMTASTNAMPASIATSDLDIAGSDAIRQPYVIITA